MSHIVSQVTTALLEQKKQPKQSELAHKLGVRILSQIDPEYPTLLRQLPDAPELLYVKGTLPSDLHSVACVGTRWPTRWGRTVTERITRKLTEEGYTIISGLALGVDQLAHTAALEAGGPTLAVLPCGLDSIYPVRHAQLAERILEQGGALISEQPFGATMHPSHFVRRNRIISGLSLATVLMQAASKGGTMHTARFCQKQARLLCVAQPQGKYIEEAESQGNKKLLQLSDTLALRSSSDYPQLLALLERAL